MKLIDEMFAMFDRYGDRHYGEDVTQREHMLQSAWFARQDDAPDSLVAAALLHDIGQFLDEAGDAAETRGEDARHEESGFWFLRKHFPPDVVQPILLHVAAKRYLCAVEPGYLDTLSAASALSLNLQGGPFSAEEAADFAANPYAEAAVRLRRYDDLGKQRGLDVPPIEAYRPLLESQLDPSHGSDDAAHRDAISSRL